MSTEEYAGTIKFEWTQHNYGGNSDASATINFSAEQFPDGIDVEYTGEYFASEILPLILRDIEAYIEDPERWIKDYISKGPDTWAKQRQLEMDIAEYKDEVADLESGIAWRKERLAEKERLLAELKAKLEGNESK